MRSQLCHVVTPGRWRCHLATVFAAVLAATRPDETAVLAHHSLAGSYDSAKPVTVDGAVTEFRFINPHPFVFVSVKAADGRSTSWRLELDNRFELVEIGMTARSLVKGDHIVATGSRGHDNAKTLYVMRLDRPADKFFYEQEGFLPRIGWGND